MRLRGTRYQLAAPAPRLSEAVPSLIGAELTTRRSPVMPVFFVLRGLELTRWPLHALPADQRDAEARVLGEGADAVAMLGGVAGRPGAFALKVESVAETCTVLLVVRDGQLLARTMPG